MSLGYIEVRYTEDYVISRFLCTECCVKMTASKVKTRSSNLAEESFLSFSKQMDGYIKNSSVQSGYFCVSLNFNGKFCVG